MHRRRLLPSAHLRRYSNMVPCLAANNSGPEDARHQVGNRSANTRRKRSAVPRGPDSFAVIQTHLCLLLPHAATLPRAVQSHGGRTAGAPLSRLSQLGHLRSSASFGDGAPEHCKESHKQLLRRPGGFPVWFASPLQKSCDSHVSDTAVVAVSSSPYRETATFANFRAKVCCFREPCNPPTPLGRCTKARLWA